MRRGRSVIARLIKQNGPSHREEEDITLAYMAAALEFFGRVERQDLSDGYGDAFLRWQDAERAYAHAGFAPIPPAVFQANRGELPLHRKRALAPGEKPIFYAERSPAESWGRCVVPS